jgi:hypothetical protein
LLLRIKKATTAERNEHSIILNYVTSVMENPDYEEVPFAVYQTNDFAENAPSTGN